MSDKKKNLHKPDQKEERQEIDFVHKEGFQRTVKRARRRQITLYMSIGVIVSFIALFLVYLAGDYFLQSRIQDYSNGAFKEIQGANVETGGTRYYYTFLSVESEQRFIKQVGDRPIVWKTVRKAIPMFGPSSVISTQGGIGKYHHEQERMIMYNSFNGERVVSFYHPNIDYDTLPHDLHLLDQMNKNTLAEFALSFDQPYTIKQARQLLGRENVVWYWVDTYTEDGLKERVNYYQETKQNYSKYMVSPPVFEGSGVYGFEVRPIRGREEKTVEMRAENFIQNLKRAKTTGEYRKASKKLYQHVSKGKGELAKEDLRIIGAVVTGDLQDLKRFRNLDFVRASTLGATVEKY